MAAKKEVLSKVWRAGLLSRMRFYPLSTKSAGEQGWHKRKVTQRRLITVCEWFNWTKLSLDAEPSDHAALMKANQFPLSLTLIMGSATAP